MPTALNFAAAADRLRRAGEARDLASDGDTAGQDFVLTGAPAFVGDAFAAAVRNAAVMTSVLPVRELPQYGTSVTVPMLDGAASAAVQAADLDAVSNTDPTTANTEAPVVSIAGRVDLSLQALERSLPTLDVVLGAELGRALGEQIDSQTLDGSGASGQAQGLYGATGITSATWTEASPTAALFLKQLGSLVSSVSTALGRPSSDVVVIMHPRRQVWLRTTLGYLPPPLPITEAPAISVTDGTGTNEDYVIAVVPDEVPLFTAPAEVVTQTNVGGGSLVARFLARQYFAVASERRPEAIGRMIGTGLVTPSFA